MLHPRLEIHESARVGTESLETRQSTNLIQSKRRLANVSWSSNRPLWLWLWRRLNHLKFRNFDKVKVCRRIPLRFTHQVHRQPVLDVVALERVGVLHDLARENQA